MSDEYKMSLRDWLSQIQVRLIGLMLALLFLPILMGLAWEHWVGQGLAPGWQTRTLIQVLVGGAILGAGTWIMRRISHRLTAIGLVADAFATRGDLTQTLPDKGRDELAWTAYSFNQMMKRLNKIADALDQIAGGDLTVEIQVKSDKDRLGEALNTMVANLRQLVGQVAESAEGVSAASEQLAAAADQAGNATSQIATTIQQVAQGTSQQAQAVTQTAAAVEQMSRAIDGVAKGAQEQANAVAKASALTAQISQTIEQVARSAQSGAQSAAQAAATKEIAELIRSIQHTVAEAVAAMDEGAREVELGASRAGEAGPALADIRQVVEAVDQQVEAISAAAQHMAASSNELVAAMGAVSAVVEENTAATEEMAAGSTEVTQAIEHIASVSQQNSAAVQEVSAAAEQMSAQVEEVNASAQALSEMAQTLQELVAQFRLSQDGAQAMHVTKPQARKAPPAPRPSAPAPVKAGVGNGHAYRELQVGRRG